MKWIKCKSPGVRFREHPSRKHGVRPDRYYSIRYKLAGRDREEALGWASAGWSEQKAVEYLSELKKAQRTGEGEQTLSEKRAKACEERKLAEQERQKQAEQEARDSITFLEFFEESYLPAIEGIRKPESIRKTREHVKNWLGPVLGTLPLQKIKPLHLEKVRSTLVKAGRSPRTVQYVMASFRTVWNKARNHGLVVEESPTKRIEHLRVSNTRQRYLKRFEAEALLQAVRQRSEQTYQISLLSLHTGMRFSEITGLTWSHIDFDARKIHILNAKGDKDRSVPMTREVFAVLDGLPKGGGNEYVFPSRSNGRIGKISKSFDLAVRELGLNDNITDPKLRFTFHCLRHTHASWMIESGTDLFLVQKQLGHSTPVVTQRYAHISDAQLEEASKAFEALLEKPRSKKNVVMLADRK